jgi:hypothetical protein
MSRIAHLDDESPVRLRLAGESNIADSRKEKAT